MPTFQNEDSFHSLETVKKPNGIMKFLTNLMVLLTTLTLCFGGYFLYSAATTSNSIFDAENNTEICGDWFCNIKQSFSNVTKALSPNVPIKGQDSGRTNFLIIGLDSDAGLADTIIIASIFHEEKKLVTFNVPRDFLVSYKTLNSYSGKLENTSFKINEVYQAALDRKLNGGKEMSSFLSKEFNIPIDYWVTVNFEAVQKTIETLGGVEVNVDNSFTDCEFPTRGYTGYIPCQKFTKGIEKMNGERALIFSRSRHGDNGEGSDFARSRRQSIVIQAVLQKLKSQDPFSMLANLNNLFGILGNSVKTSANINEIKSFVSTIRGFDLKTNYNKVIWAVGNGFLCDQTTPDFGYHIFYCDGEIGGLNSTISVGRDEARSQVKNLLKESKKEELTRISFEIYGNNSDSANKMYNILTEMNFDNLVINNNKKIIPITKGGDIVNIYIPDNKIFNSISSLNLPNKFSSKTKINLINGQNTKFSSDDPNNPADVAIWTE